MAHVELQVVRPHQGPMLADLVELYARELSGYFDLKGCRRTSARPWRRGLAQGPGPTYHKAVSARDLFHAAVKAALIREGWTVTHDPLFLAFGGVDLYVDIGAERLLAASRGAEQIAVEIKSFLGSSPVTDFHAALGQFINYRLALASKDPARTLYLAVPAETYDTFFVLPFAQMSVSHNQIPLIVYDPEEKEIRRWIRWSATAS